MIKTQLFLTDNAVVTDASDIIEFDSEEQVWIGLGNKETHSDWNRLLVERNGILTGYVSKGPDSSPIWSALQEGDSLGLEFKTQNGGQYVRRKERRS